MNPKSSFQSSGVDGIVQSRRKAAGPGTLRRIWSLLLILALLGSYIWVAPLPVTALAELTVCASGCGYTSIQSAIDAAAEGSEIRIATGVYSDVHTINGVTQIAYITKTLTLRGGYNEDFSIWNPDTYPTSLDAMGAGRAVYVSGAITVTLDGLHMLNGYHASAGGGVYVSGANLRLLNSLISGSRVYEGNGIGLWQNGGSLFMQYSTIQGGQPNWGGASTYHVGGGMYLASTAVEIHDSSILSNTLTNGGYSELGQGGGIFLDNSDSLLQGVTFRNNLANTGTRGRGGGLATQGGTVTVTGCLFDRNTAVSSSESGQAIGAGGGAWIHTNNAIISGNVFTGNMTSLVAGLSGAGGGLDLGNMSESTWTIYGVVVSGNLFQNNAAADGGGIVARTAVTLTVEDNTFIANRNSGLGITAKGDLGGATSAVYVRGNLFQENTNSGSGGGINISGPVNLLFNRFIGNHANNLGGGIYQVEWGYCWSGYPCDNATATYDGNLISGNSAAEGGGLYLNPYAIHGGDLNLIYRNLAIIDNTATTRGSGFYIYRYTNIPVKFSHLTLSGNYGGLPPI